MKKLFTVFLALGLVVTVITAQEMKQETPKTEKKCCKKKTEKNYSKQTTKSCCKIEKKHTK